MKLKETLEVKETLTVNRNDQLSKLIIKPSEEQSSN